MSYNAAFWIKHLQLTRHVEGGSFREVYRSSLLIEPQHLPGFRLLKSIATSIYFLLEENKFSAFHRIASDELWHFYTGDALIVYEIDAAGTLIEHLLGANPVAGEKFQTTIKAGSWFASRVKEGGKYSLAGCTVSPGFDFEDFELANRNSLASEYPQHRELIESLTYDV